LSEIFLFRCGQLGDEEIQEDGELLPVGVRVGQDRGEEPVGAHERFGLALEVYLPIFVQFLDVIRAGKRVG
jgi:hypothetical protein